MEPTSAPRNAANQPPNLDDTELLAAVTRGDQDAFEQIHRKHFSNLMRFAQRVTGDHEAAEEVINDTFMVVWRMSDRFQGRSKASTWMFGIAHKLAIKKRQSLSRRQQDVSIDDCIISDASDTGEAVLRRRDIIEALKQLKPELRTVVELTYFKGYLYSEIAEMVGCPVGTVKTRMMTARQHLRHFLREGRTNPSLAKAA